MRRASFFLCAVIFIMAAANPSYSSTMLEISGDMLILTYSDSMDSVILWREGSDSNYIPPMKLDIPGKWTLNNKPASIYSISHNILYPGILGVPYSLNLTARGEDTVTWTAEGLPEGLSCSTSGRISGIPARSGNFTVKVSVSDGSGKNSASFPLKIFEDSLSRVTTTVLPAAIANVSYDFKLSMNDAPSSILIAGKIPDGLTLNNDGRIYGVPTKRGAYSIEINAANEAGVSYSSVALNVTSNDAEITPMRMHDGNYGRPYNFTAKLSGIDAREWHISGRLPAGLSFDSGTVSGTPTETGKFSVKFTAGNGAVNAERNYTFSVKGSSPRISVSSMKQAFTGEDYSFTLKVSSPQPVKWSVESLPEGLRLNPDTGEISGVPVSDFRGKIVVVAKNPEGMATRSLQFSIRTKKPKVTTAMLPEGVRGEDYRAYLRAEGGPGITWNVKGKIPEGLSISESGLIEGIPGESGKFTLNASAENSGGKATRRFTLRVLENVPHEYAVASVMPMITVSEDGRYDFPVSIDANIPAGSYMEWHSFPYGIETDGDDYAFLDSSGKEIITVPENHSVTVSAWLEGGVSYDPVITARVKEVTAEPAKTNTNASVSGGEIAGEIQGSYSGCNASGIVGAVMLLLVLVKREAPRP